MLKLYLVAKQGNGVRYFPHAGYLRLTPLKVEGIVRTRLDEDNKPLLCSGLYVALRCYEARLGLGLGLGGSSSAACAENGAAIGSGHPNPSTTPNTNVLYEIVVPLWKPAGVDDYEPLGNGEWPFKIVVPPNASPVCSTVHFQEYRVFWRVEAVLTHAPMTGVGMRLVKMQEVPLVRYDTRQELPPQPPNKWRRVALPSRSSKSLPSTLKYIINNPPFPFAPSDHVPVTLKFSLPPGIDVTSAVLSIERRLIFQSSHSSKPNTLHSDLAESTSHVIHHPLPSSSKPATTMVIASKTVPVSSSDRNRQTGHGSCTVTMTLQIPQAKSLSHWSLGETIHTPLASVRFFLKSKITITDSPPTQDPTSPSSPSPLSPSQSSILSLGAHSQTPSHSYTLDLQDKELYVIATNEADRREAISRYKEALGRGRKRRINAAGKEKETPVPSATKLEPTSTPATPLTSECDSPACGRSLTQSALSSKPKLRPRQEKETSKSSQKASHQKTAKAKEEFRDSSPPISPLSPGIELKELKRPRLNTNEGRLNGETSSHDIKCSTSNSSPKSNVRSKTKVDTLNRTHRLTLGFFTPRSRRFFRQGLASDGDGNVDIDGEGDEDYVLANNGTPLSNPLARRPFGRRHLIPPSHYPSSPTSPCETSADESSSRVVYLMNGTGRITDDHTSTNVSTSTTATTASEGTEEIFGPPTPPDDLSLEPRTSSTHLPTRHPRDLQGCTPLSRGSPTTPASLPLTRPWVTLPPPSSFPNSLRPSTPIPAPTSTSTSTSTSISFSWDGREERFENRDKEDWETELKKTITARDGVKTEAVMNGASEKLKTKAKNSSTIAGIRFRKKESRKPSSNTGYNEAPNAGLSPVSCCESDSCPSPSHLSPPSPVYIPFSPSTPALPIMQTPASNVPPSPGSPMESKSNSKSKGRTLGFGINWGFGWG